MHFFEPFLRRRRAFEEGRVGELELVDAHYIHRMDWYYEKSPWVAADSDWVFLGLSHPVDLVRWYLGRIEEVHAYGYQSALARRYQSRGNDIYLVPMRRIPSGGSPLPIGGFPQEETDPT